MRKAERSLLVKIALGDTYKCSTLPLVKYQWSLLFIIVPLANINNGAYYYSTCARFSNLCPNLLRASIFL